jgi:ankyrin repeat protein
LEIVKELLSAGTDISHYVIDAICHKRWTVLYCASANGYLDIVRELLKYSADANKQTFDGSTAYVTHTPLRVHFAVDDDNLAFVQELISYTNLDLKNNNGCTVFDIKTRDPIIEQYLYEYRYGFGIKEPEES